MHLSVGKQILSKTRYLAILRKAEYTTKSLFQLLSRGGCIQPEHQYLLGLTIQAICIGTIASLENFLGGDRMLTCDMSVRVHRKMESATSSVWSVKARALAENSFSEAS